MWNAGTPRRGVPLLEARGLSGARKPEIVDLTLYVAARWSASRACSAADVARWRACCSASTRRRAGKSASRARRLRSSSPMMRSPTASRSFRRIGYGKGFVLETLGRVQHLPFHPRPARLVAVRLVRPRQRNRRPADRGPPDQDRFARRLRSARSPAETSRRSSSASG